MLCSAFYLFAQKEETTLSGFITDRNGEGIAGAAVYFHETRRGAYADSAGYFQIYNIRPGTYHLHASAEGFSFKAQTLSIGSEDLEIHLVMSPSEFKMSEVIIESESDKREQKESSQTLDVVNRQYIEKYTAGNLMNTLERLPGISAIRTGVGISKPVIRGMSFNRVLVIDNGIKQEGQQWGADHGLELDEMNADRIEILRGPSSLMYGSDAIGGVIHIRPAHMPAEGKWQASAQSGFRSVNDLISHSAMVAGNIKGNVFRVRMSTQDYGDYKVPADVFQYNRYILPIYDQRLKNTSGKERSLAASAGIQRKWGSSTLSFSRFHQLAGFFPGAFGIPREYSIRPDGNIRDIQLPRQETEHLKLSWHNSILFRKNWLETDAGIQSNHRQEHTMPHVHPGSPVPTGYQALDLKLFTYSLNIRYHLNFSQKLTAIAGANFQYQENNVGGFEHLIPNYTSTQGGTFFFSQYKINTGLVLNAGIRYDAGDIRIEKFSEPVYNKQGVITDTFERNRASHRIFANVTAASGLAWQINESWSMKFNASTDFRFPTVAELASNGVHHGTFRHVLGDAYLSPERGFQSDFNISLEKRRYKLRCTPFYNYFLNYIYLSPSGRFSTLPEGGQVFQYQEAPARFFGGEWEAELRLLKTFSLSLAYEYVNALNLTTELPLPFTPPGCLSTEAEWQWTPGKTFVVRQTWTGISFRAYQNQRRTDRNEPSTPGYALLNLTQGGVFKWGKQELKLIFQIQNLTNRTYMNHMSRYRLIQLPEPGRNFIFTLILPLQGTLHSNKSIVKP